MKFCITILIMFISLPIFSQDESLRWDYSTEGWSPLMKAIYKGETKEFSQLIKENKDITYSISKKGSHLKLSAMDVAIRTENEIALEMLLKTKKIITLNDYLITASGQSKAQIIKLLFAYGADPNYILPNGYTPIFMASKFGSNEVLSELLKRNKNINKKRNGVTVLMLTAKRLNVEKVKILLNNGADKKIKDEQGRTAYDYISLTVSKEQNNVELINELKELLKLV